MTWNWIIMGALLTASCLVGNAQNPSLPSPSPIAPERQSLPPFPAQPGHSRFPYEDRCGNPLRESMLWTAIEGRVVEVIAVNAIRIILDDAKRKHVNLAGIEPFNRMSEADEGRRRLADLVLNKRVEVLVSLGKERRSKMTAIVSVDNRDVNLVMIETEMARFREPESYTMSNYTACIYRITDQAREARRGFWR